MLLQTEMYTIFFKYCWTELLCQFFTKHTQCWLQSTHEYNKNTWLLDVIPPLYTIHSWLGSIHYIDYIYIHLVIVYIHNQIVYMRDLTYNIFS